MIFIPILLISYPHRKSVFFKSNKMCFDFQEFCCVPKFSVVFAFIHCKFHCSIFLMEGR